MDRMSFGTEAQVSTTTIVFTVCLDENIIVMHYWEYIWRILLMSLRHYFLINM